MVQRIKAAAPRAADAGVILGIENMVDAKNNAEILDRIGSPGAVKIYYDCYNLTGQGYDVPAESHASSRTASPSSTSRTATTTWRPRKAG